MTIVILKISIPIVKTAVLKNWLIFGEKSSPNGSCCLRGGWKSSWTESIWTALIVPWFFPYTRRSVSSYLKQSFLTPNWLVINDYSYFYKKNFFVTICVVSLDNALNSVMLLIPGTMLHSTCWIIIEMFNLSSIGILINI